MKLLLDNIAFSLQKSGGISIVWAELLKFLDGKIDGVCLEYKGAENNFVLKELRNKCKLNNLIIAKKRYSVFFRRFLPVLYRSNSKQKFIFHSSYYRLILNSNAIKITTIHDFTYEYFRSDVFSYLHRIQKKMAIRYSDYLVCISENTKRDLLKFYPEIPENKISVIYNGVSDEYFPLSNVATDFSLLLYVGARSGYKNFSYAVELASVTNKTLIIVGGGDLSKDEALYLKNRNVSFKFEKYVSTQELNIYYNRVLCLIYPSDYEGFGIPVIEAQKAGCPVIAQNKSSIPEVISDISILLPSLDLDKGVSLLKDLENPLFRKKIVDKGFSKSKSFSWSLMGSEYLKLYNKIINNLCKK